MDHRRVRVIHRGNHHRKRERRKRQCAHEILARLRVRGAGLLTWGSRSGWPPCDGRRPLPRCQRSLRTVRVSDVRVLTDSPHHLLGLDPEGAVRAAQAHPRLLGDALLGRQAVHTGPLETALRGVGRRWANICGQGQGRVIERGCVGLVGQVMEVSVCNQSPWIDCNQPPRHEISPLAGRQCHRPEGKTLRYL